MSTKNEFENALERLRINFNASYIKAVIGFADGEEYGRCASEKDFLDMDSVIIKNKIIDSNKEDHIVDICMKYNEKRIINNHTFCYISLRTIEKYAQRRKPFYKRHKNKEEIISIVEDLCRKNILKKFNKQDFYLLKLRARGTKFFISNNLLTPQ